MKTKPLSKITVSELIRECGINRKTFYYHFEDIYALLKWMLEQEAIEVVKQFDLLSDHEDAIRFVMDYVEENDHILNCAYDSMGRDEMKRFFYADFIEIVHRLIAQAQEESGVTLEKDFENFLCEFYTEALAGTLINWIKQRGERSREKTIEYITDILRSSIKAMLTAPDSSKKMST